MTGLTADELKKAWEQQKHLEQTADIAYQCYYEKIKQSQFWQKHNWDKLLSPENEAQHLNTLITLNS